MGGAVVGTASRFSDRVSNLLKRVEYRCARTHSEKEAVYRLRYNAYIRQGLIDPNSSGRLHDKVLDHTSNAWITTTLIDGELASTVRIHVAADELSPLPSLAPYSDLILPHLQKGRVVVDLTRLAAQLEFARKYSELPYIALRPGWMALEHFTTDVAVATIVAPHQAFYRRVFAFEPWCEPRDYPAFNLKVACMGLDFQAMKERVEARYPFLRSTPEEREALFARATPAQASARRATRRAMVQAAE